jgi:glucosamine--fructose-6-phosphate aminotransferase (isomerizing)
MTATGDTTTPVTFARGCGSQNESLHVAVDVVKSQLTRELLDGLRGRSLLFAGIGASSAAIGTPVYQLRTGGVRASRSDCADVPAGAPALADVYLAVSQSGRSRETNQLLLSTKGVSTVAITNSSNNPLLAISDTAISVGNFVDSRVSSIGFTATLVALGMLSEAILTGEPDASWGRAIESLAATLDSAEESLQIFSADVAEAGQVDVVAEAPQITSAEQSALLFREGPRVPSTSMSTRCYLHGPMDSSGRRTSHVLLGQRREGLLAEQLAERRVPILMLTDSDTMAPARIIRIPDGFTASQRSLIEIVLMQRLVTLVGAANGIDIDSAVFRRFDTKVDSIEEVRRERV